jgi:hypothetical protein
MRSIVADQIRQEALKKAEREEFARMAAELGYSPKDIKRKNMAADVALAGGAMTAVGVVSIGCANAVPAVLAALVAAYAVAFVLSTAVGGRIGYRIRAPVNLPLAVNLLG